MAISRAEIERRRQEAAHARATGQVTTVRRCCRLEGCPVAGQWVEAADRAAALREGHEHYMRHHYVRGGPPVEWRP